MYLAENRCLYSRKKSKKIYNFYNINQYKFQITNDCCSLSDVTITDYWSTQHVKSNAINSIQG